MEERAITRQRAALLLRQWTQRVVTSEYLMKLERLGVLRVQRPGYGTGGTYYFVDDVVRARIALALRETGIGYRILPGIVVNAMKGSERLSRTIRIRGKDGLTLSVFVPMETYRRQARAAIALTREGAEYVS